MTQKGNRHILVGYSLAVIGYSDISNTAAFDLDSDRFCSGVNGVFYKLLDD